VPQVIGKFVWTGLTLRGEPTPIYGWGETPEFPTDWPAPQLVLRDRRSRRLPEGSILPLSERVAHVGRRWSTSSALERGGPREGADPAFIYSNADRQSSSSRTARQLVRKRWVRNRWN